MVQAATRAALEHVGVDRRLVVVLLDQLDLALTKRLTIIDRLFRRRMLSRDGWGRGRHPVTRLGFYIRSHLIRMPLPLLLRHLWIKWRKGQVAPASE